MIFLNKKVLRFLRISRYFGTDYSQSSIYRASYLGGNGKCTVYRGARYIVPLSWGRCAARRARARLRLAALCAPPWKVFRPLR